MEVKSGEVGLTRLIRERNKFVFKSVRVLHFVFVGLVLFLAGCASSNRKSDDASDGGVLPRAESDHPIHGEVGATWGQGTSRR